MAVHNLSAKILNQNGDGQEGVIINVELINKRGQKIIAPVSGQDGTVVSTEHREVTDSNGNIVIPLTPNFDITTKDTRYRVTIKGVSEVIIMPRRDATLRELIQPQESFTTPTNTYGIADVDGVVGRSITRIYRDTLDENTGNNSINIGAPQNGIVPISISHIDRNGESDRDYLNRVSAGTSIVLLDQNNIESRTYRIVTNGEVTHGTSAFTVFTAVRDANSGDATFSEGEFIVVNFNFLDVQGIVEEVEKETETTSTETTLSDATPERSLEAEGEAGDGATVSRGNHRHQTPAITRGTSDPQPSAGQNDDIYINATTNSWWKKVSGTWTKIWALGQDGTGFDAANYFVHLGSEDIDDDTKSGIRSGGTSSWTLNTQNANEDVWLPLEFQNVSGENNVPSKATYDATTGSLVLPEGQWIVCISVKLKDSTIVNQQRVIGALGIEYDGNIRHANNDYMTNRIAGGTRLGTATQVNNIQGLLSVAGVVVSDGAKVTKGVIKLLASMDNEVIEVVGAHLHAVKAFVADSAQGEQGRSVYVQYSTDATTWVDSFTPGTSIQYMRQAVGITKPANDSTDWTPAILIRGTGGGDQEDFDPEFIQTQLDVLKNTTHDLHSPQPPPEWEDATADSQGGLATQSAAFGRISATEATYTLSISSGLGGNHIAVRIPEDKERGEYRIQIDSGDNTYYENLSHFGFLGTHNNFELYGLSTPLSSDVTSAKLQVSTGKSHIGTSSFAGNLDTDKVLEAAELPAFETTNRGQVVKRKSDGDGFEYDDEEAGVTLSDKDPEDVGTTASSGTDDEVSRSDHVHKGEEVPEQLFPYTFYRAFDKTTESNVRLQSGTTTASFTKRTTNVSAAVDVALEWTNTVSTETITNPSVKMFLDIPTVDSDHDLYEIVVLLPGTTRDITTVNIESFGRVQHSKIPLSNDTPEDVGKVASPGDDNVASRDDHVHKLGDDVVTEDTIVDESVTEAKLSTAVQTKLNEAGTTSIADNSVTRAKLSASLRTAITNAEIVAEDVPTPTSGDAGKFIKVNSSETAYELTDAPSGGGSASLSDATPHDVDEEMGSAGTGTNASREDHVHQVEGIPTALTQSLSENSLTTELQLAGKADLRHTLDLSSIAGGGGGGGVDDTIEFVVEAQGVIPRYEFLVSVSLATVDGVQGQPFEFVFHRRNVHTNELELFDTLSWDHIDPQGTATQRGQITKGNNIAISSIAIYDNDLIFTWGNNGNVEYITMARLNISPGSLNQITVSSQPPVNGPSTFSRASGRSSTDSLWATMLLPSDIRSYGSTSPGANQSEKNAANLSRIVDIAFWTGGTNDTQNDLRTPAAVAANFETANSTYITFLEVEYNSAADYVSNTRNGTTKLHTYRMSNIRSGTNEQRVLFGSAFSNSVFAIFDRHTESPCWNGTTSIVAQDTNNLGLNRVALYTIFTTRYFIWRPENRHGQDGFATLDTTGFSNFARNIGISLIDDVTRVTTSATLYPTTPNVEKPLSFSFTGAFSEKIVRTVDASRIPTIRPYLLTNPTDQVLSYTGQLDNSLLAYTTRFGTNQTWDSNSIPTPLREHFSVLDSAFLDYEEAFTGDLESAIGFIIEVEETIASPSSTRVVARDFMPLGTEEVFLDWVEEHGTTAGEYYSIGLRSVLESNNLHIPAVDGDLPRRLYFSHVDTPDRSTGVTINVKVYVVKRGGGGSGSGSGTGTDPATRDQLQALDFTVDTFSTALSQLPVYNEGAWANADATAVAAGVAYGYWAQGETPSSYNGITWQDAPFTLPDGGNRLMAIRVPSGFPIKFARLTWRRGAQTVTLPPTLTTEWNKWNVTDNPDHYDVYHLATVGTTDFAAIATQTGDVLAVQIPAITYDSTMADNAARVPALDNQLGGISHTLDEAHRLLNSITSSTPPTSGWVSQTTGDQGTQVGYADIRSNGTQNPSVRARIDFDGTYLMGSVDVGNRIPVIWTPVGADPNRYRILHERGGSTHATYPGNGQYWRRYTPAGADDVIGSRHDAFFLAAEASDAPISVTVASGDLFQLQRGPANEEIDIPESALSTGVQAKLNAGGQGLMAYKRYPLTAGNTRVQADSAAIRVPITAIPETNPYASSVSNSQFTLKAGLYDFFFGTTWYAASTGTSVQNQNQRGDVVITAHGTEVEFWQNLPYVRPVSSSSGTFGDLGHIALRLWVPQDTTVHFQMSIEAQSSQGFLGMDSIDFMCISGGAE